MHHYDDITATGSDGDACVRNHQFPCAGGVIGLQGSYPYSVDHHVGPAGCSLVDVWWVQGLAHAYPGGNPAGTFTDPIGPDLTDGLVDYFLAHPRTATGCPVSAAGLGAGGGASLASRRASGVLGSSRSRGGLPATGTSPDVAVLGVALAALAMAGRAMRRAA
jgi:hypothetical protein